MACDMAYSIHNIFIIETEGVSELAMYITK